MSPRLAWALVAVVSLAGCKPAPAEPATAEPGAGPISASAAYGGAILPIEICEHLAKMVAVEAGMTEVPVDPRMMVECERDLSLEASLRGSENWNALAGCVLRAADAAALEACDRAHPLPAGVAVGEGEGEGERQVCEHMVEIVVRETAAETGAAPNLSAAEERELVEGCVAAMLTEQRPAMSSDDYAAMLGCLGAAQTGEQIQAC